MTTDDLQPVPPLSSTGEILWDGDVEELGRGRPVEDAPPRPTRAWFVGEGPVPTEEPADAEGLALMRVQADELLLVEGLRAAVDLIGEALRLTTAGKPFVADMKKYADPSGQPSYSYSRYYSPLSFERMLTLLTKLGWVRTEGRMLLPVPGSPADGGLAPESEGFLDAVRAALVEVIRPSWPRAQWDVDEEDPAPALPDVLLLATTEGGVELPALPGCLSHCWENTEFLVGLIAHPRITDVPLDRTGHVSQTALAALESCESTMRALVSHGVLSENSHDSYEHYARYEDYARQRPAPRFTAPLLLRGAVAELR